VTFEVSRLERSVLILVRSPLIKALAAGTGFCVEVDLGLFTFGEVATDLSGVFVSVAGVGVLC